GAVTVSAPLRVRAFPREHPVGGRAVGRPEHPQPQDLVAVRQPATAVEAPVEHVALELEHRAGAHQRAAQRIGIFEPRLDLELVDGRGSGDGDGGGGGGGSGGGPAHVKMASSTAAVSASVANTWAAPAARRAATS